MAFLCLQPGQRFTRDRISNLLWGDRGEAQARASLRQALLEIRHATADGLPLLQSDREHVWAEPTSLEPEALDETSWAHSDELLFDDLDHISPEFDDWLTLVRAERNRKLADALRAEIERLLKRERGQAALPLIDRMQRLDAFDEATLRLGLRAEFQAGRVAEIERRMRDMDCRLQKELGVSVSNESKALRDELVEALSAQAPQPKLPNPVERAPKSKRGDAESKARSAKGTWTAAAIAVALLVIAVVLLLQNRSTKSAGSGPSVAVIPFSADSSDADARKLAAATHDAVTNTLSRGTISVSTIDAVQKEGRAPADFVISGRTSGTPDNVVVTVRMEETAHHAVIFSQQWEASRQKAWDLPERVGAQVATQLSWIAPQLEVEWKHRDDPAVVASLLRSNSAALDNVTSLHDYEESRRLAAKAPNSPLAQYNLAFTTPWVLGQLPREDRGEAIAAARGAADRTLKLAPEYGGGYFTWCLLHSEQRMVQCEDRLRAGMRADPENPFNSWFLSRLLGEVGREREAADMAALSFARNQYSQYNIGLMLRMLELTGQSAQAADIYHRSVRWFPGNSGNDVLAWYRVTGALLRGDLEAAQRFQAEADVPAFGNAPVYHPLAALASAVQSKSASHVQSLCAHARHDDDEVLQCMLSLARVGDLDGAYRLAFEIYPSRRGRTPAEEEKVWLDNPAPTAGDIYLTAPVAAPLRRDPRYLVLAERVGLLEYWRSGRAPDFCRQNPEPICPRLLKRS